MSAILALDYGEKRTGVAVASLEAKIANPLTTLDSTADLDLLVNKLIVEHKPEVLVVGLPRGLDGQETAQTARTRAFADMLSKNVNVPIVLQDEAGTSSKAREELEARKKPYKKSDVDALAACYILEDYIRGEYNV